MKTIEIMQPIDFFKTKVTDATSSLGVGLELDLEFYLVNLLCDFISPAQLNIDENMGVLDTPLALILKKAIESSPDMQIKVYKRLGDTSLYFAGYFQDYFNRKTFDVGYYIEMGTVAYERTSSLMKNHKNDIHFSNIYFSLSQEFRKLVAVITEVSDSIAPTNKRDLISTYQRWQQTQSEGLRRILEQNGVLPSFASNNKDPV